MIPRHCALCGLIANRNDKPFVIFMTVRGLDVDFFGACRVHMDPTVRLIDGDPEVAIFKTFFAKDFTALDVEVTA